MIQRGVLYLLMAVGTVCILVSCEGYFNKKEEKEPLARVGELYLYKEDLKPLLKEGMSKGDSASFVTNYINNWASKQLLLSKSKINLPEEKLREFDALVDAYRTDLYTRAYQEALVSQGTDTLISETQLQEFYDRQKENFKLKERIVRIRFVQLPLNFLNQDEVKKRLRSFDEEDLIYLDSIGVQFKKLNFNDSIWVSSSRIFEEIPPITFDNQDRYLKNSQFFELQDSIGVYLGKIEEVKDVNDIAPLSYIAPTIKQVLLSRRKIDYLRKLETEIIDEAIREKEFEVYNDNK
ncbi:MULTISPECIES: peptidyl-prolyl cis-trans isomerase [Maribacter]|uniref:Peptidyl-prolyl cis-trans isomerase n=1 Tax=Maribacter flavus TaxID=1658664 RepID=A0ABU7ILC8_9FLAO|nr:MULTISPECIES: peptidyl-prolyl cis-trans isomerase [Maribacter]MDC6406592.1 peptidyl-prolyl cis-trans isomerase [Maribacter sp. PR66]MEE1973710.1 peptidyl-prolyl cis-trans isomerase [Maribacter flavus]